MQCRVTAFAEGHEVVPFVAAAFARRLDVVDDLGSCLASSFSAELTEGMVLQVFLADLSPLAAVPAVGVGITLVSLIRLGMKAGMLLAIPKMGEARASGI